MQVVDMQLNLNSFLYYNFQEILLHLLCGELYIGIGSSILLMTNLYEKFFYKYDNEAEFSPTYTALTSAYVLGYARGVVHVLDAVLTAMILRKKNTSNEKDGAGAFQQPETCCGSCNDNILTTIKRLSKLLELALASVCQCSFSYLIMEWSESLVQL